MNISCKNRDWVIHAWLGAIVCGLICVVTRASAEDAPAPITSRAGGTEASTTQGADSTADENLRKRVETALHTAPYFYGRHVTVSIENGVVVLRGFVFSDWDLRQAVRIARRAADDKTVVDNLSIKEGGR